MAMWPVPVFIRWSIMSRSARVKGARRIPDFDPGKYLARYPDVEAAGREALSHYLRHGAERGG